MTPCSRISLGNLIVVLIVQELKEVDYFHLLFRQTLIAIVLAGPVGELLDTYDRDRRVLPPPVRMWQFGWTKSAEVLNGRIAMVSHLWTLYLVRAHRANLRAAALQR